MHDEGKQLVLRRGRNSLFECFETTASFDKQRDYQLAVPHVFVPWEIMNQYSDYVPSPSCLEEWGPPVFTAGEVESLRSFAHVRDDVAITYRTILQLWIRCNRCQLESTCARLRATR